MIRSVHELQRILDNVHNLMFGSGDFGMLDSLPFGKELALELIAVAQAYRRCEDLSLKERLGEQLAALQQRWRNMEADLHGQIQQELIANAYVVHVSGPRHWVQ